MSRFDSTDNDDATEKRFVPYVLLGEFEFSSATVRVCSADRSFTHQGNTFGAIGTLGGVGNVRENGNLSPEKLEFQLSGVSNSLITTTLTEDYHGRDARLWVGYLNQETYALVDTPQLIWEGFMDVMTIRTDKNSSVISLVCENRLIRWNETAGWMYTHEHQRVFDSTDNFFDQVAVIQNLIIKWGDEKAVNPHKTRDPRDDIYRPGYG